MKKILGTFLLVPIYIYRWFISPLSGPSCRHTPTCSEYAINAIRNTGPLRGLILGTNRFLRCRPGGTHGYDPAPLLWVKRYGAWYTYSGRWKRSKRLKERKK
ncbi:MAG: membrane protein insertion efficiency factor YidD [Marinilabiliaceae bacterium]|jgi:putative membrane protein insertion efficiency factor|nr:membrane protein insertion efficiency factor YidD [Marinilabiliaceae bacterium]